MVLARPTSAMLVHDIASDEEGQLSSTSLGRQHQGTVLAEMTKWPSMSLDITRQVMPHRLAMPWFYLEGKGGIRVKIFYCKILGNITR